MKFDHKQLSTIEGVKINGPILIKPKLFKDQRGFFFESWNQKDWEEILRKYNQTSQVFLQDNHSKSSKGVLRGLHFQKAPFPQGKLVRCISGEIYDVAVDIRKNSNTYGKWIGIYLNSWDHNQFWIPEGFAHGFLTVSKYAEVNYKTTNYWNKNYEESLLWNDKDISIEWPLKELNNETLKISNKDKDAKPLNSLEKN
jgi:dTDP-4-dehydrorhamnose 3,5-epimerase